MEGTYTVYLGKDPVGQVTVERQGLYYLFRCRCQLHSEVMCRVTVSSGGKYDNLGVLVPAGKNYLLTKKLPIKQFLSGTPEFWITPKRTQKHSVCLDIYPEEPFHYITKLEKAYLDKSQDRHRIIINGM